MAKEEKVYSFSFKRKELIAILIGLFATYVIVFMLGVELGKEFFISSIPPENLQQNQYPPLTSQAPVPAQPQQLAQPLTNGTLNNTAQTVASSSPIQQQVPQQAITQTNETTNQTYTKSVETVSPTEVKKLKEEAVKESTKTTKLTEETQKQQVKKTEAQKMKAKKQEELDIDRIKKEVATKPQEKGVAQKTEIPAVTKVVKPQEVSNKYKMEVRQPIRKYYIQVGAFTDSKNAIELANRLRSKGLPASVQKVSNLYKVIIGPYDSEENARKVLPIIRKEELYGYIVSY